MTILKQLLILLKQLCLNSSSLLNKPQLLAQKNNKGHKAKATEPFVCVLYILLVVSR